MVWISDFTPREIAESDTTEQLHFHALEKEMATHSSVLAWRIPGMGEPGGLASVELHRVGHNWSDLAAAVAEIAECWWGVRKWELSQEKDVIIFVF